MLIRRCSPTKPRAGVARSGRYVWAEDALALADHRVEGCGVPALAAFDGDRGEDVQAQVAAVQVGDRRGPRGEGGLNRNNITVWTSYDEGKTFDKPVRFNSGFAAYSVVQRLADGTIGLLVETASGAADRYGEITFYRFNVAELEAEGRSR